VAVTVASAGAPREAAAAPAEREIVVDGVRRAYRIHVPDAWDRRSVLPVLFVFHGAGSDAESMVRATGFDAMAERRHLLVVYPRALRGRYEVDPTAGRASADVRLVDALLARLRARFPVDDRRVFATGFSNGAALCYRLAAERPETFAAIAPVAGYLPSLARREPAVPVPLLHVHGAADRRVAAPRLEDPRNAVATWARWNGATGTPADVTTRAPDGLVLRRVSYRGPTARSDAEALLVQGQDHTWPGGPGGTVSRAVWDFFFAHPR
jgi:polyhydroxybutyrate depolymerase